MLARAFIPTIDPALVEQGACFSIHLHNPTVSDTNEDPFLLLTNPSTATKNMVVYLRRLAVTGTTNVVLRFYATPTVSANGSSTTPTPLKVGGAASGVNAYTGSTISANGTAIDFLFGFNSNPLDNNPGVIVVPPNNSILATIKASSATTPLDFTIAWAEMA